MSKPHYVVRRSRSGRFNFALITDAGRFTGSVSTELDGRSGAEIEREARNKIRSLAASFAKAAGLVLDAEADLQLARDTPSDHLLGELAT